MRWTLLRSQEPAARPRPETDQFGLRPFSLFQQLILHPRNFYNTSDCKFTLRQITSYMRRMEVAQEKFREKLVKFPVHLKWF